MRAMRWMDRFGVDASIAGDLMEQFRAGRSALWLWRQTVLAITSQGVHVVRYRPFRVIGSVIAGWIVLIVVATAFQAAATQLRVGGLMSFAFWWWRHFSVSPAPVVSLLLAGVAGASSGWIVSRASQPIVVLPYVLSYLFYALAATTSVIHHINLDPHIYSSSEWGRIAISMVALLVFVPVGIVAGGLWSQIESKALA